MITPSRSNKVASALVAIVRHRLPASIFEPLEIGLFCGSVKLTRH